VVSVDCRSRDWGIAEIEGMKVYVINLKRGVERRERISRRLRELGVAYEILEAVDGIGLSNKTKLDAVRQFAFWCHVGRRVLDGEIGCALSHASIYKRFIAEQESVGVASMPCICILEDDAIIDDRFLVTLARIEDEVDPNQSEVILLSNHYGQLLFADGYVITGPAAKAVLKANIPMCCPCDYWWLWKKRGLIDVRHIVPPVIGQDIHQTMIGRTLALSQMNIAQKVFWKVKRAIGLGIIFVHDTFKEHVNG